MAQEPHQVAVALQLGFIQLMGFLPDNWWQQLSPDVTGFVAHQIHVELSRLGDYGRRQQISGEYLIAVLRI